MKRPSLSSLLMALVLLPGFALADEQELLTIVTWGGAYEASQKAAYFEPFTAATGIEIETVRYDGELSALRDHIADGNITWDVIDMIRAEASTACQLDLLDPIEPGILAPAPDGTPAPEDFFEGAINRCDIIQLVFSTVIAYDDRAFPGIKPRTVEDFFNLEKFPGKRALRKAPVGILEWALLSLSVPKQQLYDLLSTERGFDLAFRRLDLIRDEIVWWQGGDEPVELLKSGKVAMATGYNGRFFNAQAIEGEPISVIWDGQLLDYNSWAIPKGTDQRATAERFIRFATRTQNMAAQANLISYGPARQSARLRVGLHAITGVPMRPHLPTAPSHLDNAISRDHQWYAQTLELRQKRFRQWIENDSGHLQTHSEE